MTSALDELLLRGLTGRTPWKAECDTCAVANVTRSGEQTIDGVALVAGDRVLLTAQTASKDNGIFVVGTGSWARAEDFASIATCRIGSTVIVARGTSNSGVYRMTVPTSGDVTPGVTAQTWTKIGEFASGGGGGAYTAGDGLTLTGNDFDLDLTDTTKFTDAGTASRAVVLDASSRVIAAGLRRTSGNVTVETVTSGTLALTSAAALTATAGSTLSVTDGDGAVLSTDGAGNNTLTAGGEQYVYAPLIIIGESATGHRETHDLSTTSHRRRVYDNANALALTETCLAAGSTIAAAGTLTCSGTTSGFSGSTATNLGTSAGNTVTISTATSTLTVNAATYNTASTTFSAYALGTMTLQAYGTALSLQCDSRVINIGNVAGTIRIQDRFPVAVTPGSAAATAIGAVTVPASSSGEWSGVLDLRNGATNHEIYDVSFSFNADATTVTIRDFTVVIRGTTQGTIGTVVGDVTQAVAGASLTVTISCANASGIKTALTGRGRWNS